MEIRLTSTRGIALYSAPIGIRFNNANNRRKQDITALSINACVYPFTGNGPLDEYDPPSMMSEHRTTRDRTFNSKIQKPCHCNANKLVLLCSVSLRYFF
jgi:hypothetical protein